MNKQLSRTPTPNVAAIQREIKSGVGGSIAFQFKWICKASCCPTSELTAKHTERRRCKGPVTGVQCGLFFFLPSFPASSEGGRWMNSGVARATRRCKRPIRKCVNTGEKNDGTRLGEVTRVDRRVRSELKAAKMKAKKKKKQESIHRPYLEVSAPHAAGANTSTGNTGQMHALHKAVRQFILPRNKQTHPRIYACNAHKCSAATAVFNQRGNWLWCLVHRSEKWG